MGHKFAILCPTEKKNTHSLILCCCYILNFKVLHKMVSKIQQTLNFHKKENNSDNI